MLSLRSIRSLACLLLALAMLAIPRGSFAQGVMVSVTLAPPALPVYEQPPCPGDGYIWTPGYWAWGNDDYYWVPGTWVVAPQVGYLWTPGYWGWVDGRYLWHEGWWGPHVGFYGGVAYGFGYGGRGYDGGYWNRGHFYYNTTVNHVDPRMIHNTYRRTVVNSPTRVSYNGGRGGLAARPTSQDEAVGRERHAPPTADQSGHLRNAVANPSQRFSSNHGAPPVAATPRPGAFTDRGVVHARPAAGSGTVQTQPNRPTSSRPVNTSRPDTRPNLSPHAQPQRASGPPANNAQPHTQPQHKAAAPHTQPQGAQPHTQPQHQAAPHPQTKAPAGTKAPAHEEKHPS